MFESLAELDDGDIEREEFDEKRRGWRASFSFWAVGIMVAFCRGMACARNFYICSGLVTGIANDLRFDSRFLSFQLWKHSYVDELKESIDISCPRFPKCQFQSIQRETPHPQPGRRAANVPVKIRHIEPMKPRNPIVRALITWSRKSVCLDWSRRWCLGMRR